MRITRAATSGPFGWVLAAAAAAAAAAVGAFVLLVGSAIADPAEDARLLKEQRAAIKRLEAELVLEPARREWADRRKHLRELNRRRGRRGARLAPVEATSRALPSRIGALALPRNLDALAANVRVNPAPTSGTQSEVTVAAIGHTVVAAWNDGGQQTRTGPLAFGYSLDGGRTWRGGPLPLANGVLYWESDPVLAADARRGEFWFAALAIASQPPSNAVGVLRGAVTDTGFVWREIGAARVVRDTLPDKPWVAVDSLTGAAVLSYTTFFRVGTRVRDQIEVQRSEDGGRSWSPPLRLSSDAEQGLVQGSRPAVGPNGEIHVVWASVDTTEAAAGLNFMRLRTSRDGGRTFAAPVNVAGVITNFASGAPGFNRPYAINFPSIAVDHSHGPHRGRVYVAWTEAADFYAQPLGSVRPIVKRGEPSTPFEVGDRLRGTREGAWGPPDRFHFQAHRGGTAMFYLDSLASQLGLALGIGCGDDPFELAYSDPPMFGKPRIAIVTFPRDGEYTLEVAPSRGGQGGYRIRTGWLRFNARRGRDVRDVFVAHSDDGRSWSEPARVSDAPPFFDDWLPEVAVGPDGHAYAAWYDWRDSPAEGCGARSNVSLSRSVDGGHSWQWMGRLSDRPSNWATSASNMIPNQGDYIGIVADTAGIYAGWGDGRGTSPDVFFARLDPASGPGGPGATPSVALAGLRPNPTPGAVSVTYVATPGVPARLELWDVSGRRLQEGVIDVPAGRAEVRFTPRAGLRAGVYLLRLVQGPASATARLAIVP